MKRFLIGLVLVSFLVACGSTPTPKEQKVPIKVPPTTLLERMAGNYVGDFDMQEVITPDNFTPDIINGEVSFTINIDGSIIGTAEAKFNKSALNNKDTSIVTMSDTVLEKGVITGKIINASKFTPGGELELEAIFPTLGKYAGKGDWGYLDNFIIAMIDGENFDGLFSEIFNIYAAREKIIQE